MSGGFLRNGRRSSCLQRVVRCDRSSIVDYFNHEASILTKQQAKRDFSRFPQFVFRKLKDATISPPPPSLFPSSSSSSSFASSSSSSWSKSGFIGWYLGMIKTKPILTKSVTSAGIYTVADYTSQRLTPTSSDTYDVLRTLRMAGYGMLIAGPSMHYWFNFMSRVLPKTDVVTTLMKILAGQTLFGPVMTSVFFSVNAGFQGENCSEIVARLKRDLFPTLRNGLLYWPMCDFVTFKFIPVQLQPLVSNTFAYVWTIYITYMASLKKVGTSKLALE